MTKFKESLFTNIFSPKCHYNETLECFIGLDQQMAYSLGSAEMITSSQQLEDLVDIVGTEGIVWLTGQIEMDICSKVQKLVQILKVMCTCPKIIISTSSYKDNGVSLKSQRDSVDLMKMLSNVQEFLLTSIDIGKGLFLNDFN